MIVRCVPDLIDPHLASDDLLRELHRSRPFFFFFDRVVLAGARKRELAPSAIALALINDAANCLRIERASYAVHDDLRNGKLSSDRLVAGLEINGRRHAAQFARSEFVLGQAAEQRLRLVW